MCWSVLSPALVHSAQSSSAPSHRPWGIDPVSPVKASLPTRSESATSGGVMCSALKARTRRPATSTSSPGAISRTSTANGRGRSAALE